MNYAPVSDITDELPALRHRKIKHRAPSHGDSTEQNKKPEHSLNSSSQHSLQRIPFK